jgi:hypothetical protein
MKATDCSRSVFPARRPIRPSSCNRRRWPRSRRPSRATGRTCRPNVVTDGLLSDAQLETVIYAGEAHAGHLAGSWTVDETFDIVSAAPDDAENAVRFRRGWLLGDGTGAGKGRQVAGIILDNWLQGRRGGLDLEVRQADRGRPARLVGARHGAAAGHAALALPAGHADPLEQGILFTTYATLRSDDARRRFRASGRSSNGWAPTSTE